MPKLSDPAAAALRARTWPGNVRELRNAMERAVVLLDGGDEVREEHLWLDEATRRDDGLHGTLADLERRAIEAALARHDGNRRRAAAVKAEVTDVLVVVREMTDAQALAIALTENLQRESLPAILEADAIVVLHREQKRPVDEIATSLGVSTSYVYGRLKLAELGKRARKAMLEGKLVASVALVIARIPDLKLR